MEHTDTRIKMEEKLIGMKERMKQASNLCDEYETVIQEYKQKLKEKTDINKIEEKTEANTGIDTNINEEKT